MKKNELFDNLFQILYPFRFLEEQKGRIVASINGNRGALIGRDVAASLHFTWEVKCAGTLQSFWLLVVCRLTGWRQRVGSWMMLEKQTIRHVTNASQRPRKPSGYVPLSLSLFHPSLCPSIRYLCASLCSRKTDYIVRLWLQFLFASVKKKKKIGKISNWILMESNRICNILILIHLRRILWQ